MVGHVAARGDGVDDVGEAIAPVLYVARCGHSSDCVPPEIGLHRNYISNQGPVVRVEVVPNVSDWRGHPRKRLSARVRRRDVRHGGQVALHRDKVLLARGVAVGAREGHIQPVSEAERPVGVDCEKGAERTSVLPPAELRGGVELYGDERVVAGEARDPCVCGAVVVEVGCVGTRHQD